MEKEVEAQRDEMTHPRLQDFQLSFVHKAAPRVGGGWDAVTSLSVLSAPMSKKFLTAHTAHHTAGRPGLQPEAVVAFGPSETHTHPNDQSCYGEEETQEKASLPSG